MKLNKKETALYHRIMFRIDSSKFKELEKLAQKEERTLSNMIRTILSQWLKDKK